MAFRNVVNGISVYAAAALIVACASQPASSPAPSSPAPVTAAPAPADTAANEKDTAAKLEKRFQDAARGYKVVQKDNKTLYCKREKQMGSTIPTLNCMTEAQLRNQVESMEEYRNRARNSSRCTTGVGCGAGG
jgi:hypothetical protein